MTYTNPYGTDSRADRLPRKNTTRPPDQHQPQSWLVAAITVIAIWTVILTSCLMVLLAVGVLLVSLFS